MLFVRLCYGSICHRSMLSEESHSSQSEIFRTTFYLFSDYTIKHVISLLMMLLRLQGCEMGISEVKLLSNVKKIAMKAKLMISVGII